MVLTLIILLLASLIVVLVYLLQKNKGQLRTLAEQQQLLRASEARYRLIAQQSNDIIFEYDLAGGYMVYVENSDLLAAQFLCVGGLTNNLIRQEIIHPLDVELFRGALKQVLEEQWSSQIAIRARAHSNDYRWYHVSFTCVNDEQDRPWRVVGRARDVDAQIREEKRLKEIASRDPLTNLLNKIATRKEIDRILTQQPDRLHAFLIIDVDFFKQINDRRGHSVGDTVLTCAAHSLRQMFRSSDILGRIGGDEMVIFCSDIKAAEDAQNRAGEVCELFRTLRGPEQEPLRTSCSIGVAIAPTDGGSFNDLYVNADLALYAAKEGGRNRYEIYTPQMKPTPLLLGAEE